MKKQAYIISVGEAGNELGHMYKSNHVSAQAAIRKARRMCAEYQGDGWYIVHEDTGDGPGEMVDGGGRQRL
jgi:hypothetical protein